MARTTSEIEAENDKLRFLLAKSQEPCIYCNLSKSDMSKCPSGFPGCSRADDLMLGESDNCLDTLGLDKIFVEPDLSLIKSVVFFDSYSITDYGYGILIFIGIDGTYQFVEFDCDATRPDSNNYFEPVEISKDKVSSVIDEFKTVKEKYYSSFGW